MTDTPRLEIRLKLLPALAGAVLPLLACLFGCFFWGQEVIATQNGSNIVGLFIAAGLACYFGQSVWHTLRYMPCRIVLDSSSVTIDYAIGTKRLEFANLNRIQFVQSKRGLRKWIVLVPADSKQSPISLSSLVIGREFEAIRSRITSTAPAGLFHAAEQF